MPRPRFRLSSKHLLIISLLLIILISSATFLYFRLRSSNSLKTYTVEKVIDGDTFKITDDRNVRLYGLDAPEIGLCGGKEAKAELEKLISGKKVKLKTITTDSYDRFIALVYLDNILVNERLLATGWVRPESYSLKEKPLFLPGFQEAKDNNLGIYQECIQETPPNPKCNLKGNIGDNHTRYYFPTTCGNYQQVIIDLDLGDTWFCSVSEAEKAEFTLSPSCSK